MQIDYWKKVVFMSVHIGAVFSETDKISIALATYNGERFLREQLDSIYGQTYKNIEVIACDDCSTDSTVEILEEYKKKFGLVYYINEKNLGFVRNFEKLFTLCSGNFIALADQDDIWLPNKLEILIKNIGDSDLIYSDAELIDENGDAIHHSLIEGSGVIVGSGRDFGYFLCNTSVTGCTVMFRRSLLEAVLPIPEFEKYHDWWLALCAAMYGGVKYTTDKLVKYRQHGENDTGANKKTPLHKLLLAYLSGDISESRVRYYKRILERTDFFLNRGDKYKLTSSRVELLNDLRDYADSLLGKKFHIRIIFLVFKYKNILFPKLLRLLKFF